MAHEKVKAGGSRSWLRNPAGTAVLENSVEDPRKMTKRNSPTIQQFHLGYMPKGNENTNSGKCLLCLSVFVAALSTTAETWKPRRCPRAEGRRAACAHTERVTPPRKEEREGNPASATTRTGPRVARSEASQQGSTGAVPPRRDPNPKPTARKRAAGHPAGSVREASDS